MSDLINETDLQSFRRQFFGALDRRHFAECQALLDRLQAAPLPAAQQEYEYYYAKLLFAHRQFDQAELRLRRLLQEALPAERRARTLLELAAQLNEQWQTASCEALLRECRELYATIPHPLGEAKACNNLGIALTFQVEQRLRPHAALQEAVACHQQALALLAPLPEAQAAVERSLNWHGLGRAYALLQAYAAAQAAFATHQQLCAALDYAFHQAVGLSDWAALVYQPQGQWAAAGQALTQAIALFRAENDPDPLFLAEALTRRGNLLAAQRHFADALVDYEEAVALAESLRSRLIVPLAQAGTRAQLDFIYTAPLTMHLQLGNGEAVITLLERARSRVLVDLLAGEAARPHLDLPDALLEQRQTLQRELEQGYAAALAPAALAPAEQALAVVEGQIAQLDPAYAGLQTVTPLTGAAVRRQLAADALLLTYAIDATDQIWLVLVTPERIEMRPAPAADLTGDRLQRLLLDYLDGGRRGILVPAPGSHRLAAPDLLVQTLYRALIEPFASALAQAHTLYLIPTGALYHVPFAALLADSRLPFSHRPARQRLVYAPSATLLFNYCHQRPPSQQRGVLAVAPEAGQLPFMAGLAQQVAAQPGGQALLGAAAGQAALYQAAAQARLFLFLGHTKFAEHAYLASWLNLADGPLRAGEILQKLRLDADLVVLASCESGRSHILRGDEMLGLVRALLYAGSPAVLATHWPVHEIPNRLLLDYFLQQLHPTAPAAQAQDSAGALAAAQQWLRTLRYAQAHAVVSGWQSVAPESVTAHLHALWQMTTPIHQPSHPPASDALLFQHPFFWAAYFVLGESQPR